jgi:hypothetical protein
LTTNRDGAWPSGVGDERFLIDAACENSIFKEVRELSISGASGTIHPLDGAEGAFAGKRRRDRERLRAIG